MDQSFKAILVSASDKGFDQTVSSTADRLERVKAILAENGISFEFAAPISVEGHFVLRLGV